MGKSCSTSSHITEVAWSWVFQRVFHMCADETDSWINSTDTLTSSPPRYHLSCSTYLTVRWSLLTHMGTKDRLTSSQIRNVLTCPPPDLSYKDTHTHGGHSQQACRDDLGYHSVSRNVNSLTHTHDESSDESRTTYRLCVCEWLKWERVFVPAVFAVKPLLQRIWYSLCLSLHPDQSSRLLKKKTKERKCVEGQRAARPEKMTGHDSTDKTSKDLNLPSWCVFTWHKKTLWKVKSWTEVKRGIWQKNVQSQNYKNKYRIFLT